MADSHQGTKVKSRTELMLEGLAPTFSTSALETLSKLIKADHLAELRLTPGKDLFTDGELTFLADLNNTVLSESHIQDQTVLILKATRLCNLRCTYCNSWREGPGQVMTFEVLARIFHETLKTPNLKHLDVVWHGGEITLLKPSFIERALWMQEQFRGPNVQISHAIQTNATHLTEEWLALLKKYKIAVGVSIDGPPEIHDLRRVTKDGKGSWLEVKRGIKLLQEANIPFGALAVIDECAIEYGAESYLSYLSDLGIEGVALLNALPPNSEESTNQTGYFNWSRFQSFLVDLFRVWWKSYKDKITIRELEALIEAVKRGSTGLCLYADNCMGKYLTIEPNGGVSACDKYVGDPGHFFGSLVDGNLNRILGESDNLRKAKRTVDAQKNAVSECEYFKYCRGGCPHDSRLNSANLISFDSSGCCGLKDLLKEILESVV